MQNNKNRIYAGRNVVFVSTVAISTLLFALGTHAEQADTSLDTLFPHSFPLTQTGSGSLTVAADLGGVQSEFLLDTGASLITVSPELFAKLNRLGSAVKVRKVAARTAGGRLRALDVYRVERFVLGDNCELGPVEVAVMRSGGRNLLGLAALQQAAPFAVSTTPPALGLARCGKAASIAAL